MYKIYLNLKSFDVTCLKRAENSLVSILSFLNVSQLHKKMSPKKCKKITVLRSPHIDKKSREHYQIGSHKRTITATVSDKKILVLFFKLVKNCQFVGIELEISLVFLNF